MSRTARLLDLIQLLRTHRAPVTGPALAQEMGVSLRTLYRDIATLQGQGADIAGRLSAKVDLKAPQWEQGLTVDLLIPSAA